jgi:hypothetical protein
MEEEEGRSSGNGENGVDGRGRVVVEGGGENKMWSNNVKKGWLSCSLIKDVHLERVEVARTVWCWHLVRLALNT